MSADMELLPRLTARSVAAAVRLSGAGQASSMPGKVVNALFPGYLASHARRLTEGLAVVTGTNGKTTTANMAARALADAGRDIVHNSEGANLLSGIATAFARRPDARLALLEIDEAIVPSALARLGTPRVVVLMNLFRDQLDRYGEVDRLAAGWLAALRGLSSTVLIANADDPLVTWVAQESGCETVFFGVEVLDGRADHEVSDVTICPRCATMLEYTSRWLSQLGDYRCPSCGFARPPRDLEARGVSTVEGHAEAQLAGVVAGKLRLRMPGLHNIYNALGTLALAQRLGVKPASALESLAAYQPVFGRWSLARRGDTAVQVNLVKNPAGMNQTLRALREVPGEKALVFVLNDNIADGRDISWIWDVDMEELLPSAGLVVTSGTRKHEMALRLSYAGVPDETLASVDSVAAALSLAAERHARSVYLLPTYTALKEVRGALRGWEVVHQ
jgi:lipid II isoglutaminyl synthase (glutamine-hydrolysing)